MIKQAVIIAGGLGTRLSTSNIFTPKLLLNFDGESLLSIQIKQLASYGIKEFLFLLGYNSNIIINEIDSLTLSLGLKVSYVVEESPAGTGGALTSVFYKLDNKFLLIYGDILFATNLDKLLETCDSTSLSCVLTRPTNHFFDSDIVELSRDNAITNLYRKPVGDRQLNNIALTGIYALVKQDVEILLELKKPFLNFDHDCIPYLLLKKKMILAIPSIGYVRDVGTPSRLEQARIDWKNHSNWRNKKKAVFLDRDGVINLYNQKDVLSKSDFYIIDGFTESIRIFRELEYLIFVVTNQSSIAKGFLKWQKLQELHAIVDIELAKNGLYLDGWYVCPHHPDKGFKGEVSKLKIMCECRKPGIGLFQQIEELYSIDRDKSWVVGDQDIDSLAAKNYNVNFAGIGSNFLAKPSNLPSFTSLQEFARFLSKIQK